MKIRYIGRKPFKGDNVTGSGHTWAGRGDVTEVPNDIARKLLAHSSVWIKASDPFNEEEEPAPPPAPKKAEPHPPARNILVDAEGREVDLDAMDDTQVRALAVDNGLDIPLTRSGRELRRLVVEKVAEATASEG